MKDTINALQVGRENIAKEFVIPEGVSWYFLSPQKLEEALLGSTLPEHFDMVLLEVIPGDKESRLLCSRGEPYTFFYLEGALAVGQKMPVCYRNMRIRKLRENSLPSFLFHLPHYFHHNQVGSKLHIGDIELSQGYQDGAGYCGNYQMMLRISCGQEFVPLLSWRRLLPVRQNQALDLWLEYEKEGALQILLVIRSYGESPQAGLLDTYQYREKDMADPIRVEGIENENLSISLMVRGQGRLRIGDLHYRPSRFGMGSFLPGGQVHMDQKRHEFFSYFDPGDRKAPLNVYFAGYRSAEGFEGLHMMKGFHSPFLLLSDPRLEGGSFYVGSSSLEYAILQEIQNALDTLGFTKDQLVLSGLSMGTYGAMYYGCKLSPRAILLGKPLFNLGTVAENETLLRPGVFPTSLDVLQSLMGGTREDQVKGLNEKLWKAIEGGDFSGTEIAVAYMENDDYDRTAYEDLTAALKERQVRIVGKGITGRHNDNNALVMEWFLAQYRRILRDEFGRVRTTRS